MQQNCLHARGMGSHQYDYLSTQYSIRVQRRSSIIRIVTTAMLSFSFLQMTSSVATLDTCSQPGGKENTLETILLIKDVRGSTGVSLYWAKGMETTGCMALDSTLWGRAIPDSVQGNGHNKTVCSWLWFWEFGVHNSVCVFIVVVMKDCMLQFSRVRLLDTLLEQ